MAQQELQQVSAIDRLGSHTELKHWGGGTAAENMSIVLFKKRWSCFETESKSAPIDPDNPARENCCQKAPNKKKQEKHGVAGLVLTSKHSGW